jgi:hypothetical protein
VGSGGGIAEGPVVEGPVVEGPVVEGPVVEGPVVEDGSTGPAASGVDEHPASSSRQAAYVTADAPMLRTVSGCWSLVRITRPG